MSRFQKCSAVSDGGGDHAERGGHHGVPVDVEVDAGGGKARQHFAGRMAQDVGIIERHLQAGETGGEDERHGDEKDASGSFARTVISIFP